MAACINEGKEWVDDFVTGGDQLLQIVKLGEEGKIKVLKTAPLCLPPNSPRATFLIGGDTIKNPKDCRRDSMGQWSARDFRCVEICTWHRCSSLRPLLGRFTESSRLDATSSVKSGTQIHRLTLRANWSSSSTNCERCWTSHTERR